MLVVNIQDSERYYLLLLLLRILEAVSFDVLKTVDGIACNTFQQACKMQRLLEGDQYWYDTSNEAIQTRSPFQLRLLFATICSFGEVNDIPELWFRYKDALGEDFVRQYSEDSGPQYAFAEIEEFLKYFNLNRKKLELPTVHLPDGLVMVSHVCDLIFSSMIIQMSFFWFYLQHTHTYKHL
ncbi:hypothetical protein AVEN_247524-1 [Araneus ventricosus]|uniref:Uncharacterized protein n=1 Tax=Araneus ventricosus TaxID=182803 RepID=A0A4Y2PT50_ARAVE|nr:hypothetical protein AVEN_247524-1 [Araneus ventricosus]